MPFVPTQTGAIASALTSAVVLFVLASLVYRWYSGSTDDGTAEDEQSGTAAGFPLASWRYVYDVEKADANREIASVQQQADDLAEAEREARR